MSTKPKFVVVGVYPDGVTHTRSWELNPMTYPANTIEDAVREHRAGSGLGPEVTIYALPLADFIKHATPERKRFRVTRSKIEDVYVTAVNSAEAAERGAQLGVVNQPTNYTIVNVEEVRQ